MKTDKTIGTLPSLMFASAEAVPAIFKGMAPGPGEQQVGARVSACSILWQRRQRRQAHASLNKSVSKAATRQAF